MSTVVTVNPATGRQLAEHGRLGAAGLEAAPQRAADAQARWREVPVAERAERLRRLARLLRDEVGRHGPAHLAGDGQADQRSTRRGAQVRPAVRLLRRQH